MVLGGWSDISVHSEVGKGCLYFRLRRKEIATGPHAVETDIAHEPVDVGSLGVNRIMLNPENLSALIGKF